MSDLRSRLTRLEKTRGFGPIDAAVNEQTRREFFGALGRVLAPFPEAKQAVGQLLAATVEANEAGQTEGADAATLRREFLGDLGRTLDPFPEAKAAVGNFLERHLSQQKGTGH